MIDEGPVEERYVKKMRALAEIVDEMFNGSDRPPHGVRRTGFVLLVFPFGEENGRMNYMSNADRLDMVKAIEELLDNMRGRRRRSDG